MEKKPTSPGNGRGPLSNLKQSWLFLPGTALLLSDVMRDGLGYFKALAGGSGAALEPFFWLFGGVVCLSVLKSHKRTGGIESHLDHLGARIDSLADEVRSKRSGVNYAPVPENEDSWTGWCGMAIVHNPAQTHEATLTPMPRDNRYKIVADAKRLLVLIDRLSKKMDIKIIVYAPRMPFGVSGNENPAEVLLKLVFNLQSALRIMKAQNIPVRADVRFFMIDGPRPTGSEFLFNYEAHDGRIEMGLLAYFRTYDRMYNIASANEVLVRWTSETAIQEKYAELNEKVKSSVELTRDQMEKIIAPLLPDEEHDTAHAISLEKWRDVLQRIYRTGLGETIELIASSGTEYSIATHMPSLDVKRVSEADEDASRDDEGKQANLFEWLGGLLRRER
jgi:hypothetical protein